MAAMIVAGEMAGIGVLALPRAVADCSWIGLVLIVVFGLAALYTARTLGETWTLLQERYAQFRCGHIRYPYPLIAQMAVGKWMKYVVSFSMDFTLFGSSIVYLLLASQNAQNLLDQLHVNISFCYWVLIISAVLIPLAWFGTPKDFWPLAVGAIGATTLACILIFIQAITDSGKDKPSYEQDIHFLTFSRSFGAMAFAWGAHSTFPTIQHDMKNQSKFPKSCLIAFGGVFCLYLPVTAVGYLRYGVDVQRNVVLSLPPGPITTTILILITIHLVFAIVIIMNPLSQDFEEIFRIPHSFNWKRCLLRTLIVLAAVFIAESIPHFGAILDLVGGSSVTFLVYVAPPFFYVQLCKPGEGWIGREVPLHKRVLNYEIILVGVLSGIASIVAAVHEIAGAVTFVPPCYVNVTAAKG